MTKVVGNLRARLGLDNGPFKRGLRGAEQSAGGFAKRLASRMAVAGAAMAAAATAAAGVMVANSLTFVDNQAKVARTIDGSIDALRALQMAAGDAGVAQSDLNRSMQMIGARLVEAKVKGGAAADALDRLGLSADDLLEMDADARLAAIADRVKELGLSSSQATQFLMDMGVRSKEMALLLTGGGDAIRSARQEIEDLGLSMNAVDAAKVEAANDALSRIKLVFEAIGNRLAVAFAPALERVAKGFSNSMREGGALRRVMDAIGTVLGSVTGLFSDVVAISSSVVASFRRMGQASSVFSGIKELVSRLLAPFIAVIGGIRRTIGFLAGLIRTTGSFGEAMGNLKSVAVEVWQRIGDGADYVRASVAIMTNKIRALFFGAMRALAGAWVDFTWTIAEGMNSVFGTDLKGASAVLTQELGLSQTAAEKAGAAASDAMKSAKDSFSAPLESLARLRAEIRKTGEETETILGGAADQTAVLNDELERTGGASSGSATAGLDRVKEGLGGVRDATVDLNNKTEQSRDIFRDTFKDVVKGASSAKEAVAGLLDKFSDLLLDRAFNSLFGGGDTRSGGGAGGGLFSNLFGGLLSFDGGGWTGTGARSGGLDGRGGFLAMLHPEETVVDHTRGIGNAFRSQGGGGRVEVVALVENGNVVQTIREVSGDVIARTLPDAFAQYDRQQLPQSMQRINNDPRARG